MTFDEAWNQVVDSSLPFQIPDEASDAEVLISDLSDIFEELKQEYAPTVEMTQEQYQQFIDFRNRTDSVQTHAVTLHDKRTKYPEFLNDLVGGVYGRLFLQAWLHPETIKIVDE